MSVICHSFSNNRTECNKPYLTWLTLVAVTTLPFVLHHFDLILQLLAYYLFWFLLLLFFVCSQKAVMWTASTMICFSFTRQLFSFNMSPCLHVTDPCLPCPCKPALENPKFWIRKILSHGAECQFEQDLIWRCQSRYESGIIEPSRSNESTICGQKSGIALFMHDAVSAWP